MWSYSIIFCGHFPDQTYTFSMDDVDLENEDRGHWYVRQLLGAANIDGGAALPRDERQPRLPGRAPPVPGHALDALRRDRPARAGDLRAVRAALQPGPAVASQLGGVHRTIIRLAFPGGKPRKKPGPYKGPMTRGSGETLDMAKAA